MSFDKNDCDALSLTRLAAERGIDEELKARDMLRWIAEMNNIKSSAEEIVFKEVIYK